MANTTTFFNIYYYLHVAAVVTVLILIALTFRAHPSKGQNSLLFFLTSSMIYILGFCLEIMVDTEEATHAACIVEYFGEFLTFLAALRFVSYVCHRKIPAVVYAAHALIEFVLLFSLIYTMQTGLFYKDIVMDYSGPVSRGEYYYGPMFFVCISYFVVVSLELMWMMIGQIKRGTSLDKKRNILMLIAFGCCWVPYLIKLTGITKGYEIPGVGILLAGVFLFLTLVKYGMLDSLTLASENALDHGQEGILVLDSLYNIQYGNAKMHDILGDFSSGDNVKENSLISDIIDGDTQTAALNGRIYEFRLEALREKGFIQGHMLWAIDSTEHHENLKRIQEYANHDPLTGLYNRNRFQTLVERDISNEHEGTFIMIDMDNFKLVNDSFGHQRGDRVLQCLADILMDYSEEQMYSCRLGGDEFCLYLRGVVAQVSVTEVIEDIMSRFSKTFRADDALSCSLSAGIVRNQSIKGVLLSFDALYTEADRLLYEAKNLGKNRYCIL